MRSKYFKRVVAFGEGGRELSSFLRNSMISDIVLYFLSFVV